MLLYESLRTAGPEMLLYSVGLVVMFVASLVE